MEFLFSICVISRLKNKNSMETKKFQKRVEDFVCEHCGVKVIGNGFTNHCPQCLWGKHVDVNPGDRAAACGGMMEPIGIETSAGDYTIVHRCIKCGFERKNKAAPEDSIEKIVDISTKPVKGSR